MLCAYCIHFIKIHPLLSLPFQTSFNISKPYLLHVVNVHAHQDRLEVDGLGIVKEALVELELIHLKKNGASF